MLSGHIVAAFGRQYEVLCEDGQSRLCFPRAKKSLFACGDRVRLNAAGDAIDELLPRKNLLYRADAWKEKLIAANLDQILLVVATEPAFSDDLLNRCLCSAEAQGIEALIVLNKADLLDGLPRARAALAPFAALGYAVVELSAQGDVNALMPHLHGKTSLLVGQSGMGKSTLTNALIPAAAAATREISTALDSGKHTTTHARRYPFTDTEGALIDSPGLQVFGLSQLSLADIEIGFRELGHGADALPRQCRFRDCRHENEPNCAVRQALEDGRLHPRRYQTLIKLLQEKRAVPQW